MAEILLVEDNESLREVLVDALALPGYTITACKSAEDAFEKITATDFDLVITDLKLPEADGIAVLKAAKERRPDTEVVIITAYGTVDKAVSAMKIGAGDFITKPFSIDHIRITAEKMLRTAKLKLDNAYLRKLTRKEIIGSSQKLRTVLGLAAKTAANDATVLITGESGTGKELVAEEIHDKSTRRDHALVKVNCAALAPGVLESELFGHEKGAFTDAVYAKKGRFEIADKGTLFLDEIADLPLALQVKLLRVLQDHSFERVGGEKTIRSDVRIIAATNKDLKGAVKAGTFREDLFYRLNVVEINVPSLRERREDIPALADYFLKKYADFSAYKVKGISRDAMEILTEYDYPGNIRELENIIQRLLVSVPKEMIEPQDIPYEITRAAGTAAAAVPGEGMEAAVTGFEKNMIVKALNEAGGNRTKAAEALKVNRATMLAKMKKYGIE